MSMAQPSCREGVQGESMLLELWPAALQTPPPFTGQLCRGCTAAALALGAGLQQGSQALLLHQPKGTKSNGVILSSLPMAALKGQCLLRVNN